MQIIQTHIERGVTFVATDGRCDFYTVYILTPFGYEHVASFKCENSKESLRTALRESATAFFKFHDFVTSLDS